MVCKAISDILNTEFGPIKFYVGSAPEKQPSICGVVRDISKTRPFTTKLYTRIINITITSNKYTDSITLADNIETYLVSYRGIVNGITIDNIVPVNVFSSKENTLEYSTVTVQVTYLV